MLPAIRPAVLPSSIVLRASFPCPPYHTRRYSWVVWDAWWASPVFLATLATAPLKWVPWADKCWIWPGLI